MPLLWAISPTQPCAAPLYKGSYQQCLPRTAVWPCFFPSVTVMRGEMSSVVSCSRTSFLRFLLRFLGQLVLKMNSFICWNFLHYFAATPSKHPGWADTLQTFLYSLLHCISWRVAPLVWNVALLCLEFVLGMFQWYTIFHKWIYPQYCTYLLPIRDAPGKCLCRKEGPFLLALKRDRLRREVNKCFVK